MAKTHNIELVEIRFPDIEIACGDTIVWTNRLNSNHTITADDGEFDSGILGRDESFSHVFNKAGTVGYHCEIHPQQNGTITVT